MGSPKGNSNVGSPKGSSTAREDGTLFKTNFSNAIIKRDVESRITDRYQYTNPNMVHSSTAYLTSRNSKSTKRTNGFKSSLGTLATFKSSGGQTPN